MIYAVYDTITGDIISRHESDYAATVACARLGGKAKGYVVGLAGYPYPYPQVEEEPEEPNDEGPGLFD